MKTRLTISKKLSFLLAIGYIKTFNSLMSYVDSIEFNSFWGDLNDDIINILNEDYNSKFREGKTLFMFVSNDGNHISQFRNESEVKEFIDIAYLYATSEITNDPNN